MLFSLRLKTEKTFAKSKEDFLSKKANTIAVTIRFTMALTSAPCADMPLYAKEHSN